MVALIIVTHREVIESFPICACHGSLHSLEKIVGIERGASSHCNVSSIDCNRKIRLQNSLFILHTVLQMNSHDIGQLCST